MQLSCPCLPKHAELSYSQPRPLCPHCWSGTAWCFLCPARLRRRTWLHPWRRRSWRRRRSVKGHGRCERTPRRASSRHSCTPAPGGTDRQTDMERLATLWGKPCRTQIEDVTADLLEYQAAPHPGPSVSSHNLTPSPGLQDWREAVNTPPWHHQSDWCYWINIEFKLTESLKDEGKRVCIVFCSEGDDVLISGTLQDFWHTG